MLHAIIGGATPLGGHPVNILAGALDVAGLAVDAVLSVDLQTWAGLVLTRHKLVHSGRAESLFRAVKQGQVPLHRYTVVSQREVGGLVVVVGT